MPFELHSDLLMSTLLENYPGARRALFARFHIGGCQSCAYKDDETLAEVCQRNEIGISDALNCLEESQRHDQEMLLTPGEVQTLLQSVSPPLLLDIRTREEYEALTLPNSKFVTQELQNSLFSQASENPRIILFDHQGRHVLDQCAWFRGHGLTNTYGMDGGIDRWSREVDSSVPRYRLEMD